MTSIFFVATSEANSQRLLNVFDKFGFGDIRLTKQDFTEENFVVEIGREPRKIQVLTGIDGVDFQSGYGRRTEVSVDGLRAKFIGKDDLVRNKVASGRPKDRIDVEELKKL